MTITQNLNILRNIVLFLIMWNLVLTFCLVAANMEKQAEKLNQEICNLEAIPNDDVPQFEIMEVE